MVYICILNLIYNYVSRILLWTTFEFSVFWCSNWTYNVDFMKHVVVCFNLNLSIFVKQLLSEDHDCGLILWKSKIFFTNFYKPERLGCGLILKIILFFLKLFGRECRTACGEWTGHLSRTCIIFSIRCVYFVSFLSVHSCLGIYVSPWHMSCRWGSL